EPRPLTAAEIASLDALARSLPPLRVPAALVAETQAAMRAEVEASRPREGFAAVARGEPSAVPAGEAPRSRRTGALHPRRVLWPASMVMAMAAGALVFLAPSADPVPAPADRLIERGVGERLPDVSLKVAVKNRDETRRHDPTRAVGEGDQLYFRVRVDQAAELKLVRVDGDGAAVIHATGSAAGESDLRIEGMPVAWSVEAGEEDAVFAVLASGEGLTVDRVEAALGAADVARDADAVCRSALLLGARCDATIVKVDP
ncbi:MAG: hypothetical protein VX265_16760, partial [Myxococcota bacterium]|nr:hypothetical protein [Myxococcota bacterium]